MPRGPWIPGCAGMTIQEAGLAALAARQGAAVADLADPEALEQAVDLRRRAKLGPELAGVHRGELAAQHRVELAADRQALLGQAHAHRPAIVRRALLHDLTVLAELAQVVGHVRAEIEAAPGQLPDRPILVADIEQDQARHV